MAQVNHEVDPQVVQAVDQLLARFEWRLLGREAFIRLAATHMAAEAFDSPNQAAFNLYTLTLYGACMGQQGQAQQELAFAELGRYLADIAQSYFREYDPDLIAEALSDIFLNLAQCRKPGAFLAFAQQRLRDLVRRRWQDRGLPLEAASALESDDADSGLNQAISAELRERVLLCGRLFLARHKGAQLQFLAVWLKYMQQLDDQAIAAQLGKEPRQVYVLRSRGLKKLRNEPAWQALSAEFGFPPA
jgi:DNA-directed RNA polymerase specialized sigma24 family protein